ncbi:MAG: amidohydrolase family protein [Planctomycetota bacterium]|nr:amidohydrolase family protein [Planctomycetota bacterium]
MSLFVVYVAAALLGAGDKEDRNSWTISAEHVYTAAGKPIEGGLVTVEGGKIRSVSKGDGGDLECYAVTPGLIDLSVRIERNWASIEQSREVTPEKRIVEAIDWFDEAWKREARSGVTTVMINPLDRQVVGGLSVVVKTAGESVAKRTVKGDSVLYGAIGSAPSASNHPAFGRPDDIYSRRPTTRMGVEWEWRKAFFDAAVAREDEKLRGPGTAELQKALSGDLPLMVQAWTTQDIRTAVFLKEELEREKLGSLRLIVDAAAEAWREPDLLVRCGAAVVLPPWAPQGRSGDGAFYALDTGAVLVQRGLTVALSGHGAREVSDRLAYQPGHAMRGGMSLDAALAAVTINPARIAGIDKRVGSLESGKDADLVLWSGPPFEASSAVIGVLVDGRLILDPRNQSK